MKNIESITVSLTIGGCGCVCVCGGGGGVTFFRFDFLFNSFGFFRAHLFPVCVGTGVGHPSSHDRRIGAGLEGEAVALQHGMIEGGSFSLPHPSLGLVS